MEDSRSEPDSSLEESGFELLVPLVDADLFGANGTESCTELSWAVPADNEHVAGLSIVAWTLEDGEPKRAIAVHALENLATSDTGISMPRRKLREQIERVRAPAGPWSRLLTRLGHPGAPHNFFTCDA